MTASDLLVRPRSAVQVTDYPPSAVFGPRRMRNFEFVWVLSGSARWQVHETESEGVLSGPREFLLRPGELFLAKRGQVDTLLWDAQQPSSHAYVHMDVELPGSTGAPAGEVFSQWPVVRSMQGNPPLAGLCSYLLDLARMDVPEARVRSDQVVGLMLDIFV